MEYLAPGVFVEEISLGPKPIEGVSTSTAAFVGLAEKGPHNTPTLITNPGDFNRVFGGFLPGAYLAYAVDGFFRNGGKRCFVVRVADLGAAATAEATLLAENGTGLVAVAATSPGAWAEGYTVAVGESAAGSTSMVVARLAADHAAGATELQLASAAGLARGVRVVVDDGGGASETFQLDANPTGNTVPLPAAHPNLVNAYPALTGRVYVRWATGDGDGTVRSAAGFSAGSAVLARSADPTVDPVFLNLTEVRSAERRLSWAPAVLAADVDGAALVELKRVELALTSSAQVAGDTIPEADVVSGNLLLPLLREGDWVAVGPGVQAERRQITNDPGPANQIVLASALGNVYPPGVVLRATVTPRTGLYTAPVGAPPVGAGTTLNLSEPLPGIVAGDALVLRDQGNPLTFESVTVASVTDAETVELVPVPVSADLQDAATDVVAALENGDQHVFVADPAGLAAGDLVRITAGGVDHLRRITAVDGLRLTLEGGPWNAGQTLEAEVAGVEWAATTVRSQEMRLVVRDRDGAVVETFNNLSMSDESPSYFARQGVVTGASTVIVASDARPPANAGDAPTSLAELPAIATETLTGGADGHATVAASDFVGATLGTGERTGIASLEPVDEVSILCVPDLMMRFGGGSAGDIPGTLSPDEVEIVQLAMIEHCERLQDRFAVLDSIRGHTVQQVQAWRNENLDSRYAALYYPWIEIGDPIRAGDAPTRLVPPSGYVAGIYARVDNDRGVHKAPANEVLRGVVNLERAVTKGEQEILNPDGVNAIRAFPGRGIRVWGARTVSSDSEWKYVNVRRLFLFLEESLEEGTQWVVFEPNAEPLWAQVKRSVSNFLTRVWRSGALMGTSPEEAYFVNVDRTTMTQDDIDNGRLIMVIGVAPVKPAEFVIIRIGQWDGGASLEEL